MANIREIAEAAGVSITTVSRVLNGHPYVKEEKRQKFLRRLNGSNMQGICMPFIYPKAFQI